MSDHSPLLKIELPGTGEFSGTWGEKTNTNLGTAIEEAITGIAAVDFAIDDNKTLTLTDNNTTQDARHKVLNLTSTPSLTATRNLIVPTSVKEYLVWNNTTGGQDILVKTSAGSGIPVAAGERMHLFCDGTDVVLAATVYYRANTVASAGATLAWNSDDYEQYNITAQAAGLTVNADSGSPTDGYRTIFRIKDNGTARALTWTTGVSKGFRAIGVILPTTTVANKQMYIGAVFNKADDRWDVIAVAQES